MDSITLSIIVPLTKHDANIVKIVKTKKFLERKMMKKVDFLQKNPYFCSLNL